jgi:hypothetical protein
MIGAIIAQAFSFAATLSLVFHARPAPPVSPLDWLSTIGIALALEILFIYMKEGLFRAGAAKKIAGAVGLIFDGIINTGGVLPFSSRILTFAPIALMLGVFGVNLGNPLHLLIAGVIFSTVLGFLLSILPHWLWPRRAKQKAAAA